MKSTTILNHEKLNKIENLSLVISYKDNFRLNCTQLDTCYSSLFHYVESGSQGSCILDSFFLYEMNKKFYPQQNVTENTYSFDNYTCYNYRQSGFSGHTLLLSHFSMYSLHSDKQRKNRSLVCLHSSSLQLLLPMLFVFVDIFPLASQFYQNQYIHGHIPNPFKKETWLILFLISVLNLLFFFYIRPVF